MKIRRIILTAVVALVALGALAAPSLAADSLALSVSGDPTEDQPVTVTVTGNSEAQRRLFVYRELGGSTCSAAANQQYTRSAARALSTVSGDVVGPGSINRSYAFTPTDAGAHRLCAYLAESDFVAPIATQTSVVGVRLPTGSLALSVSGDPTEDQPVTVTVTGNSEAQRRLFVYRELGGSTCSAAANQQYTRSAARALSTVSGDVVGPGSINRSYAFTPTDAGAHRLCAYLAESDFVAPIATQTSVVGVRCNGPCPQPPAVRNPAAPGGAGSDEDEMRVALAAPSLAGPATAVRGEQLNPTFEWSADPTHGARYDRLRIQRNESDGSTTKLADVTAQSATSYLDVDDKVSAEGAEMDTSDIARFTQNAGTVSVTLKTPLSPGEYSWFVLRSRPGEFSDEPRDYIASESRTFTVLGPKLTRLSARTRNKRGRTSPNPGYSVIEVKTTPFARVRYDVRRQGRRTAFFSRANRSGDSELTVSWNCDKPGGRYLVRVVASDQHGTRLKRTVRFAPVSKGHCTQMRRAEARAHRIQAQKRRSPASRRSSLRPPSGRYRKSRARCAGTT